MVITISRDSDYLQAYVYLRKKLVNSLNALPNLNTITVAQLPFNSIADPPIDWNGSTRFDSLYSACSVPQLEEASPPSPQVYGLEAALSIFQDLKNQNTITLNLTIDLSHHGFNLQDHMRYTRSHLPATATDHLCKILAQMFNCANFDVSVVGQRLVNPTIVVDPHATSRPPKLCDVHVAISDATLPSLTFKSTPIHELPYTICGFLILKPPGTVVPRMTLEDTDLIWLSERFHPGRCRMLKSVGFRNCEATSPCWYVITKGLYNMDTLDELSFVGCEVRDVGENDGMQWLGDSQIREKLRFLALKIRPEWGDAIAE